MTHADYWERRYAANATLAAASCLHTPDRFIRWLYRAMAASVTLVSRDRPPGRVLDVGSGTGEWIAYWQRRGASQVSGCDLSETSVRRLAARYPTARVVQEDISKSRPYNEVFDTICSVNVLQHITDDAAYSAALHNLRGMAQVGSRLVLLDALAIGRAAGGAGVSRVRSLEELSTAAAEAGWRVVACRPSLWLFNGTVETQPRLLCWATRLYWRVVGRLTRLGGSGSAIGACLYPLDRVLSRCAWGPTTKTVVAEAV